MKERPQAAGHPLGCVGNANKVPLRIGGMALGNGLLLQSKAHWAAAIREKDGRVSVASGAKKLRLGGRRELEGTPILRGPLRMLDALVVMAQAKRQLKGAVLPVELPEALGSAAVSTMIISAIRRFGGARRSMGALFAQETAVALLSAAPAVVALRGTRLAQYHGAEHKSIGAYELRSSGRAASDATKEHDRCGSNLIGPLLVAYAAGTVIVRRLFREPPPGALLVTGIAALGVAMEVFRFMAAHPERLSARILLLPGRALQRCLTTEEPTDAQLEVGRAALDELLRLEGEGA